MKRLIEPRRSLGMMHSIQAKLLTMLAVLSLPLLVVSLLQLERYRENMNEQAWEAARAEARVGALALEGWLENHPEATLTDSPLPRALEQDLYRRLRRYVNRDGASRLVVRNARGRIISEPSNAESEISGTPDVVAPASFNFSAGHEQTWTNGARHITSVADVPGHGWAVAIGLPPIEQTSGGQSSMLLATVWALALAASILLGVWASGRFTTPLLRLTQTAIRFGEGDLKGRAVVETRDEVGTLAGGFNRMAESLEARFAELEAQSLFINEVLDNLPLGVVVFDDHLAVRKANRKFKLFTGRDNDTLHGRGLYEAAAGLARLREIIEDVRRTRRPFVSYGLQLELRASQETTKAERELADQPESYWDIILYPSSGASAGDRGDVLLILNEVSDRVRAERLASTAFAAERTRAAELASVINQMDDGVVIVDRRGRYRVNPTAARILAREPGEFRDGLNLLIEDIGLRDIDGRLLDPAETPLRRALDHGARTTGARLKIRRRALNANNTVSEIASDTNGKAAANEIPEASEERVLSISATPLADEAGERAGLVAIFRDITEEVAQHNQLVAAYDRLREHDQLKSAFVANVSHELRTPLNVIIGLCQLLERDRRAPLAADQLESIGRMDRNARNLLLLVNNLLDYSRLEAGRAALHTETVDVEKLVREVVERGARSAAMAKGVRLEIEIAPNLRRAQTDRQKLSQIIENLIGNAVKFTQQGEVQVKIAEVNNERWLFQVSDTGIGMTKGEQQFVFEEFRQGDERLTRSFGGAGLGLAITGKIVELLGGEISVESTPGVGSRFSVYLDYASPQRTGTGSLLAPEGLRDLLTRAG